ncbi:VOC family protein [Actinomadura harenae]|uniref:Extradiol dioxygenase n=1 Tax=Actinomadura harenae TaxID=2483351 RepID=A0A3M2MBJ2_9ACTN|nr:VOC family protein [Actinomadura harenae]RMI46977.1 extradiol dioxygenase [Actinomadura harenae]
MINGAHVVVYSEDADADRAFLRDVLGFPHVDVGGGWLIFRLPPAELAAHPTEPGAHPTEHATHPSDGPSAHELYLMCDDVTATVDDLTEKGVEFPEAITDAGWGLLTRLRLPSGAQLGLYEPRHPTPPNR